MNSDKLSLFYVLFSERVENRVERSGAWKRGRKLWSGLHSFLFFVHLPCHLFKSVPTFYL